MSPPPLVIVAEYGRHDAASRRIVRAQAARASASQSRLTRARNRGEREPRTTSSEVNEQPAPSVEPLPPPPIDTPLRLWLHAAFPHRVDSLVDQAAWSQGQDINTTEDRLRLPPALPRGFVELARHIHFDKHWLDLISQAACFDLASPGLEQRLEHILSDFVSLRSSESQDTQAVHDVVRTACMSLLLYHAKTLVLPQTQQDVYSQGLQAAWDEVRILRPALHPSPDTARVVCWATIMISVTAGVGLDDAAGLLGDIVQEALRASNVQAWDSVRAMLLDFIFPSSTLETACIQFLQAISRQ